MFNTASSFVDDIAKTIYFILSDDAAIHVADVWYTTTSQWVSFESSRYIKIKNYLSNQSNKKMVNRKLSEKMTRNILMFRD